MKKTNEKKKSQWVEGTVQDFFALSDADTKDIYLATERLRRPAKTYSAKEMKRELGL